jgi:MATE family multidrug resistance protein
MAARALSYWSMMGLTAQTTRWEKAMTGDLVELTEALERAAVLQTAAAEGSALAAETLEQAEAEKVEANELRHAEAVLLEESEANAALAARDDVEAAELEEEIVALEAEAAAHAGKAAVDQVLAEEEAAEAAADTAEAAQIEAEARGEEIGIAFCELIPILDVACDVIGGVTAVGLESGAALEAAKAASEIAAAGAAEIEEEREAVLAAEAEESAVADQAIEGGVQADASEKSELAEEERLQAQEKEAEANVLLEKSEADEAAAGKEEITAADEEAESASQTAISMEKAVGAAWNAILASACGVTSLAFFFVGVLRNVVFPGARRLGSGTLCMSSSVPVAGSKHPMGRNISYVLHHCVIFVVVASTFQPLLVGLSSMSLKARGGVILGFACTSAFLQTMTLHILPSHMAQQEELFQLFGHFCRRMIVIPVLFTMELLIVWVVFGPEIFGQPPRVAHTLLLILWVSLSLSLAMHVVLLELPRLKDATYFKVLTKDADCDDHGAIATEMDSLLPDNVRGQAATRDDGTSNSWTALLYRDLCSLQIPLEILIVACLSGVVLHSVDSLKFVWPTAKPILMHSRPKWLLPVATTVGATLLYLFAFSTFCGGEKAPRATRKSQKTVATRSCWSCVLVCGLFLSSFSYAFQTATPLLARNCRFGACFSQQQRMVNPTMSQRNQNVLWMSASSLTSEGEFNKNVTANIRTSVASASKNTTTISDPYHWTSQSFELAIPALVGMLADPLLSLMDTAYVGRVGPTELAALGACTSIFHLAFNAFRATTAATTSLVGNAKNEGERKQVIQLSLSLGVVLGILVMTILQLAGPWSLSTMGVPRNSLLFPPAIAYLGTRLWAAPAVLAIVVAEGAFRGYGDTKIPLLASLVASFINLILDPILMFPLGWGVKGAAAATGVSQVGALAVYIYFLIKRGMLPKRNAESVVNKSKVITTILGANLAMITKQGSLLLAWAYATAKATRIGSAHVAAHQVALSCWLVFALILDGAAVSAQVLMSRSMGQYPKVKSLVSYMLRFSVVQGLATTGALLLASPFIPKMFTPDLAIRHHLISLMPHLAWQQLLVSLTLVTESLAIGGNQFQLLAFGTTVSTVLAMAQLQQATTVVDIWRKGIVTLFAGRLATALIGTFRVVRSQHKKTTKQEVAAPQTS